LITTALITGGATGIGLATAKLIASRGVNVVLSGRHDEAGAQAVAEIKAAGGRALFLRADVTDEKAVEALIGKIVAEHGGLHMAVNNAGISTENKTVDVSETADYRTMIEVNVLGLYYCMKYELRQMAAQGGGAIVNIASVAGLNGIPWAGTYASTKHAVVGLTKSSALDFATQGVRVNAVAPGAVKTKLIEGQIELGQYDEKSISAMHPMGRMGEPIEIANGVAWLLSDEASFVTGHVLNIDGGFQAK
jgi:NAD(P)-dependent dehydrogenase (short-subunit alcohol dehydrogenase family)